MDTGGNPWVKNHQKSIAVGNEEAVPSKQQSNVRGRLTKKVNSHIPQMLSLLPDVVRFLTPEAREQIQTETSPYHLAHVLGDLYTPEQRRELMYALVQQEEGYGEDPAATIDEVASALSNRASNLEEDFDVLGTFDRVRRALLAQLGTKINEQRRITGVEGPVSQLAVARWIAEHESGDVDLNPLPRLFTIIFNDEAATSALHAYARELQAAVKRINSEGASENDQRTFEFQSPSSDDFAAHQTALERLEQQFTKAVTAYWDQERLMARDSLLVTATSVIQSRLKQDQDRDILAWVPCKKNEKGWTRYYTRRANRMVETNPPVLSPVRESGDTVGYEPTAFGGFVAALLEYDGTGEYDGHLTEFTDELGIEENLVDAALDDASRAGTLSQ